MTAIEDPVVAPAQAGERNAYSAMQVVARWVVVGGESGAGARPMHPRWAADLRDQCAAADVPFLFKQWGEWGPGAKGSDIVDRPQRVGLVQPDGRVGSLHDRWGTGTALMSRVGKKAAGRELDHRLHDGYPAVVA